MRNWRNHNETAHYQMERLKQGGNLQRAIQDDDCILVVYGEGGGCTLEVSGGVTGLWVPLHGSLRINNTSLSQSICSREALVTEHDARVRAIGHANSRWVAILARERAWTWLLASVTGLPVQLLPEFLHISPDLRRKAVAIARSASRFELEGAVHAIADDIVSTQSELRAAIGRCPGKTYTKRRQVFLRLQRVRNFIGAHCEEELDNEMLARMANYSPCHFLRTFAAVFLDTPHAYLVDQRLVRARRLLRSGELAVTEVAFASGFENRCAFSRSFRKRFGTTAKEEMRRFHPAAS